MAEKISARDILRLRLAAQLIEPIGHGDVASTVRHLLAIQAQDFAQALWAVGARTAGSTRASVLNSLDRGEIVRTLPMRGTLHFVHSSDLRWMLGLTAERSLRSAATRFGALGLDQPVLDRAERVTRDALAGGKRLARDEYLKLLASAGIDPSGQRGYHIIFYLTQLALVCWGPSSGAQQALVLVDEWIPQSPRPARQQALESFALRYFAGHGPATERDLAWWTKLTLRDVRDAIDGLGDRLARLSLDGVDYFLPTDGLEKASSLPTRFGGHLLPGFDEYLLAYQDRSLALETADFDRIVPGSNGIFRPIIVSRGRIVGSWARDPRTGAVEPEHFREPRPSELAALVRSAARYRRFLGV